MTTIKPIPTMYRGTLFRSKLEASWARWFDERALAWVYEPEGYVLPDGTRYLLDFWMPAAKCFVEVKGVMRAAGASERTMQAIRAGLLTGLPELDDLQQSIDHLMRSFVKRRQKEVRAARANAGQPEAARLDAEALVLIQLQATLRTGGGTQ